MKKRIIAMGTGPRVYYNLITLTTGFLIYLLRNPFHHFFEILIALVANGIYLNEVVYTYMIIEKEHLTLSRRFRKNNKSKLRKDVLNITEISQVGFGDELKLSRREQTYSGRHSGYTPRELVFKVNNKYIPIDAKAYSKKNLKTLVSFLNTYEHIELFGTLSAYL